MVSDVESNNSPPYESDLTKRMSTSDILKLQR